MKKTLTAAILVIACIAAACSGCARIPHTPYGVWHASIDLSSVVKMTASHKISVDILDFLGIQPKINCGVTMELTEDNAYRIAVDAENITQGIADAADWLVDGVLNYAETSDKVPDAVKRLTESNILAVFGLDRESVREALTDELRGVMETMGASGTFTIDGNTVTTDSGTVFSYDEKKDVLYLTSRGGFGESLLQLLPLEFRR